MIKNAAASSRGWLLTVAALAVVSGCRAREQAPLQGVVEYDTRVIGFEFGGRVSEMKVDRGQEVEAGALLARLDDSLERPQRELRAADLAVAQAQVELLRSGTRSEDLRAAEAEIAAVKAQEVLLAKNLARQRQLQAVGAAPVASLDELESQQHASEERRRALEQRLRALRSGARSEELAAADARVQAAAAGLAAADARLARYALTSPAAGNIVDYHVKSGEVVAPGAPVVTLADLTHPYLDVFVPQAQLAGLAVGNAGRVRVDGAAEALPAQVEYIYPRTEFTPRFLFSESERPNLVVRVRVRVQDPRRALHQGIPGFVELERTRS